MSDIRRLNSLLRSFLSTITDQPMYKWVHTSTLIHHRFTGYKEARAPGQVTVTLLPQYTAVPAYPHLGQRWLLAKWEAKDGSEWLSLYGNKLLWPQNGDYYPTSLILKPGKSPTLEVTEELIARIKHHMTKTEADFEAEAIAEVQARDKSVRDRHYDILMDSLTAYGNDPGKRNGGVSFASDPVRSNQT